MKINRKKYLQIAAKTVIILISGILLGALLLTLAYCIPINSSSYHSTEFSTELQGWYPNVPNINNSYNTYFQTYLPGVLDNATVRTFMLPITWAAGDNPLYTAIYSDGYSYYWHGYVIFTRLLQTILNYEQIQMAGNFFQIALIVMLAVLIGQKKGMKYAVMLISSYVLMMPMAIAVCLQYYSVFFLAYGTCFLLLAKSEWFENGFRLYYLFLIVGMLTSYFDLLTYPLITWGLPMIWWLVVSNKTYSVVASFKKISAFGIAWIIGYGGMWFGKWVLASIVLKENIILKALEEIILRSGVDTLVTFGQANRFYSLYMNWMHYTYKLYVIILVAWLSYWLICGFFFGWTKINTAKCFSYLLVGASSIVWYLVLLNHTEVHHAFTYRIFAISIAAFFAIVLESTEYQKKTCNIRHSLRFCIAGICLIIVAIPLTLCAKEITLVDNKNYEFEAKVLSEDSLRISFVPEHDKILSFCVGLQTESTTGQYELTVNDGDCILYTETIPVSFYGTDNFRDYIVDWNLTAGKEYLITINIQNVEKEVYTFHTAEGVLPLTGCQYYEGNSLAETQPLLGIHYWCLPTSKQTLLLLAMTYWGMLWILLYSVSCLRYGQKN